jgi:ParB family chromosome partitioning protein
MAKALPKISLNESRDIPFNKLILSQSNVRRIKFGVTIADLADDIERRGLITGLNVRPHLDEAGSETDMFEIPAGGRRYLAIELLVKRKRAAATVPVPCVVKAANDPVLAEEDSLAENTFREPLHPLDEFRGMQRLSDRGEGEEAIAAHFRVTPAVVKQRLKLASVSPKLHEVYATGDMTLDHLMAFTVSDDHARQEQVWELLPHSRDQSPQFIKDKLNEDLVPVGDRRVRYIGVDAYFAAGGSAPTRDLFEPDDGGWLADPALVDRLVAEKLEADAAAIKAEGWKWVEAMVDLPYGYDEDCRYVEGTLEPPTEEDEARIAELRAEADALEAEWAGREDVAPEVEARAHAIDVEIGRLSQGRRLFDPEEQARAGVFIGIEEDGTLYVDRGNVLPEDEPEEQVDEPDDDDADTASPDAGDAPVGEPPSGEAPSEAATAPVAAADDDDDEVIKPLPDRLVAELTASRTVALQDAFAQNPSVAFAAVLHAMVLTTFHHMRTESCVELSLNRVYFPFQAAGLRESAPVKAMAERHAAWKERLPNEDKDVWDAIQQLDGADQAALFAHCAAGAVNALWEPVPKHGSGRVSAYGVERRIEHANVLARAVGFDMVATGWRPTVENYLGRVTKPRILEAVAEGTDPQKAGLIDHLKKGDMAREAERLLADSGWLPEPLRLPVVEEPLALEPEPEALPAFLDGDADASGDDDMAIAAE